MLVNYSMILESWRNLQRPFQSSLRHMLLFHLTTILQWLFSLCSNMSGEREVTAACRSCSVSQQRWSLTYFMMVQLRIFQLYNGAKVTHIHQKPHLEFRIWIFFQAGDMWHKTPSRCQAMAVTLSPGQQPTNSQPFCAHTTILLFPFSAVFNKWHETFNTLL